MGIFDAFKRPAESSFSAAGDYARYIDATKNISSMYFKQLEKIQSDWSLLYNLKDYTGFRARRFEDLCKNNIHLYKQMNSIALTYHTTPAPNAPAFKRLAMLYEKQEKYNDSVAVCVDALDHNAWGDGMQGRLVRMLKKAKRDPNAHEQFLIDKDFRSR